MSNHTSGPWHVTAMHKGIRPSFHSPGENGGFAICEMYADGRDVVANARLIAAAPDLLEALEESFDFPADFFERDDMDVVTITVTGRHLRMVRDAIAKARGQL